MSAPQGIAAFGGLVPFFSFSMTLSHGVTPSVATFVIPPTRSRLLLSGTLVLSYGPRRIVFPDARVDRIEEVIDESGYQVWRMQIMDRRWRWGQAGKISGYYNVRRGQEIVEDTKKTPQELARLLLDAMGETRYDIRQMPNNVFPEIEWDYANPAEELDRLAQALGCFVSLTLRNTVTIYKQGIGRRLPNQQVLSGDYVVDPPDPPDRIVVTGARTRYQADFELEAVGLEPNGDIVPIDDLSYKPKEGWNTADSANFLNLDDVGNRKFAEKSIWKWYRIKTPFTLPTVKDEITSLDRILPILNQQVEQHEVQGRKQPKPPWVHGKFWDGGLSIFEAAAVDEDLEDKPEGFYQGSFRLQQDTGIVEFSEPVYRTETVPDGGFKILPADLRLRVAVNLRDKETRGWIRHEVDRRPRRSNNSGTVRYAVKEDLIRGIYKKAGEIEDNKQDVERESDRYLIELLRSYQTEQSATLQYVGLVPIELDGQVRQVSWTISDNGEATTRAAMNHEDPILAATYEQRRFIQRIAKEARKADKTSRAKAEELKAGEA